MFAPDHERAAAELVRVVKAGGKIGLATWTPEGFIGELLRAVAQHVPPAAGVASPILWGTETHLRRIFGDAIASIRCREQTFVFRSRSAESWVDFFRAYYGPTFNAFEAVGPEGEPARSTPTSCARGRVQAAATDRSRFRSPGVAGRRTPLITS